MTTLNTGNMSDLYAPGSPPIYYQSLAIFFGYLAIAAGLIISIIRLIGARFQARQKKNEWASPQRRTQFYLFSILSALSLGFTWFHMICLFVWSYRNWFSSPDGLMYSDVDMHVIVKIGLWLKNTYVFQEAWETVSENAARFWWSGQIFGWTIGWSIFLGITGKFDLRLAFLEDEEESLQRYVYLYVPSFLADPCS